MCWTGLRGSAGGANCGGDIRDGPRLSANAALIYMEMKGDSNGRSVFKTLAAGTDVEFGLVQAGSKGDEGDNYISTSHIEDENVSSNIFYYLNHIVSHCLLSDCSQWYILLIRHSPFGNISRYS